MKGATSPHMITGLTNGKQYDFAIRAINGAGPGPWTTTFTATPRP
ncbi:MAG: fibronectin type III domain-containing protein [Chloroflexi bacterium]|nr:fibronectin type III domain-containing protein [Chloroflexota bacterium]